MDNVTTIYTNPIDCDACDKVNALTDRVTKRLSERASAIEHIAIERAQIVTDSWKATDGEPLDIRRAKLFAAIMEKNPVTIHEGELIVGSQSKYLIGASPCVDYNPTIAFEALKSFEGVTTDYDESRTGAISLEERKILKECAEYWKGRSTSDQVLANNEARFPWIKDWDKVGLINGGKAGMPPGAKNVNYGWVIDKGLEAIIEEAKQKRDALEFDADPKGDTDKFNFYSGVIIALEGAITFAKRYSALAKEMAEKEADAKRKAELLKIAEVCERVPAKPARNFQEACQAFWFTHLCENLECSFQAESPSRIDQYLYPMYKKDVIDDKTLSRQDAAELFALVLVKINEIYVVKNNYEKNNIPGTTLQATTICGQTADGKDASNELSYIILECQAQVNLPQPPIYVRYHKNIDQRVWLKAIEVNTRRGDGNPAYMSDETRIPGFVRRGIALEDARNWSALGCAGSLIGGYSTHGGSLGINYINLAKIMELVMYDGKDPKSNIQIGPHTGDPRTFTSYKDFIEAFKKQFDVLIAMLAKSARVSAYVDINSFHTPYLSALLGDCLEKGLDARAGGVRYPSFLYHIADRGLQDVSDSITAIRKLVFEDKKLTIDQIIKAMDANFEGFDYERALLRSAPKYGNDDDYADEAFDELSVWLQDRMYKEKNPFGTPLWAGRSGAMAHVTFGRRTGPLPSGHKLGDPIADGFCSPSQGCDTHGPTCVFNSASKVSHVENSTAALMNMKFDRRLFKNKDNIKNLGALLENYFNTGGFHVQINIIDQDELLDASAHPENHQNLMVRVAGYSAFFVDLPKDLRQEIISRTSEGL